ncbi:ROK family protein [Zunongwangia endophytica]|uniref:ROK family protein n=1 Tax=Zunongwangia endophytica TaxID=1808945 RepID=A0ABV8HGH1_9FLAO|nr:ROK family protein [Zunongwangia endophytica]MDN3596903.1 ROK family protein [Zunongwangia endophytica]
MSIVDNFKYAIGIDLGGTFVKSALVCETGAIRFTDILPIGTQATKDDILDTIEQIIQTTLFESFEKKLEVVGIGIGTPGIVFKGIVIGAADNLQGWENIDLAGHFSNLFKLPVSVDNDANLMGYGELHYGAARGSSDVICLTIGTGIGGAIIINGAIYSGYKSRGGELGHIVVEHNGIDCNCGGKGCLEAYASTSVMIKRYIELSGNQEDNIDGLYIIKKFKQNDNFAIECIKEHTEYLGHGIASFINTFAPQKIVIGGGISDAGQFYIEMIKKVAFKNMMPDCGGHTEIVGAQLGNIAGSLGAAAMAFAKTDGKHRFSIF